MNVHKGEILAIAGVNGSGKSTLMKVISGYEKPLYGTILLNDLSIEKYQQKELAQLRCLLSQETHIPYSISVLETVVMGRFPYLEYERASQSYEIAREILSDLEIGHLSARDIRTLSGGERQKVHFARVMAQISSKGSEKDRFILLDEPLKGLDMAQQHFILAKIQEKAKKDNVGVVMILHDLNLAAQYSNRIILLANQSILADGNPRQVLTIAHIKEAYGMNALVTEHPIYHCPMITSINKNHSKIMIA